MKTITLASLLIFAFVASPAYAEKQGYYFDVTIKSESETFVLKGEPEFIAMPSFYNINMIEDNDRCVIHMLNFSEPPGPGTYDVEDSEVVRTAIVCILENADPRERLVSKSGTFTITKLTDEYIQGHFDMILLGPISGKEFRITGRVKSDKIPSSLKFD